MTARRKRLYSLFAVTTVNGRKRYEPLSDMAFSLNSAREAFQDRLIAGAAGNGPLAELRPIAGSKARFRDFGNC